MDFVLALNSPVRLLRKIDIIIFWYILINIFDYNKLLFIAHLLNLVLLGHESLSSSSSCFWQQEGALADWNWKEIKLNTENHWKGINTRFKSPSPSTGIDENERNKRRNKKRVSRRCLGHEFDDKTEAVKTSLILDWIDAAAPLQPQHSVFSLCSNAP